MQKFYAIDDDLFEERESLECFKRTILAVYKSDETDQELSRLRERVGELKRALEHVRASAQTGTYDGGVVISFAALEAVRNALAPLIAEAVKPTPIRVSDPPCRNERDGTRCTLERHHDGDHEHE